MTMRESRSILWKSIRNYRFHSIFIKNLLLLMCVNLLPVFCMLTISYYSYDQISKSERDGYAGELIARVSKDADNVFGGFKDKMMVLALDDKLDYFFTQKKVEYIDSVDVLEIMDMISNYNVAIDGLADMYIYATANQMVAYKGGYFAYDDFDKRTILDQWCASNKYFHIEYVSGEHGGKVYSDICVYYVAHYSSSKKGIVVFCLDRKELEEILDYGEDIRFLIANDTHIIFDSAGEHEGADAHVIEELFDSQDGTGTIYSSALKKSNLRVILQIARQPVNEKMRMIKWFMISFCGVMMVATIVLVFYISKKIFDPFHEIMDALKEDVSQVSERKLLQNINEVSHIKQSIYATLSSKHDVEKELINRIHLLKKAQAVALQAQIEPHFVNNILENINQKVIASMGRNNEISQLMSALSSLLVVSLCSTDTFITLEEEIEYVQQYLFIQSKLLGDKFDVDIQIPEEIKACKLVKLILQPVVENAIKYGIKPYTGRGKLTVRALRQEDSVCIEVQDTGLGMTEEEVAEVNDSIRRTIIKESEHIGLSNVNQRIILAFGEEYGVTVKSRIGMGTTVEVRIPCQI